MNPFQITVYSKEECSLCDEVTRRIERVAKDVPIQLHHIDITFDPEIYEKYKWVIPVVHIDGEEVFVSKMAEIWLRRELQIRIQRGLQAPSREE
jgi:hypothetical protein